jgi:hypothetical protein
MLRAEVERLEPLDFLTEIERWRFDRGCGQLYRVARPSAPLATERRV